MFGKKKDTDAASAAPAESKAKGKATAASKSVAEPQGTAAPKVAKASKGKGSKRKNTLAKGGPGFFAAHIEKLITLGILAAVGFLVYSGFSTPGYDSAAAPDKLEREAKDLLNQISQDHWAEISADPERQIKHDFATQVAQARRPTDPKMYNNGVWDPKPLGVFEKRGDPKLLPPEQLVVKSVAGALAVEVPIEAVDPYDALEDAEPIRPKQKKSSNRRAPGAMGGGEGGYGGTAGGYGGEAGYAGGMAGGTGMAGGPNAIKPKRYLRADYNRGVSVGGGMAGGMGMAGSYGGEGGGAGYGGGGMYAGGGAGMMGPGGGVGGGTPAIRNGLNARNKDRQPKIKIGSRATVFNAITALVPHKKMVEEYLAQFQDSGSFIPARDMPAYLSFELQRVDVTADPTRVIAEKEWTKISDGTKQVNLPRTDLWAARPFVPGMERPLARPLPDVIDRNAGSPGLTMPIPPLLVHDYREFCKHPQINWIWDTKSLVVRRPKKVIDPDANNNLLPGSRPRGGAMGGGAGMAGGGMYGGEGGGYGGGMGGYGGGMGGYGGEAGYAGGAMGGYGGEAGYGGGMGGYGGGGYGGGGYGGEGGGMYGGGMAGGGMGMSPNAPQPEFKMVRCYDFLTQRDVAKVFRYRIRLIMRDPNYPEVAHIQRPAPNTLKDEVWARVAPLIAKEDQAVKADPKNAMRTSRFTDWSEPSPPVRVELPSRVLAGDVEFDGPKTFKVDGQTVALTVKEPKGNVVATTMDWKTGAMFAMESDVRRGSVLVDKVNVELIVPSSRLVKIKKDQPIDTRSTIVDLRGGKPLAGDSRDDPLKDIGEMMVLKPDGSVHVTNEFDDMFLYRMYRFADEHEMAEKMSAGPAGGAAGMGAGYGGGGY